MQGPKHIAVILDGNRRYAKKKGVPAWLGHDLGAKKLDEFLEWCKEYKVEELTLYTFSLENFNREKKEVDHLFELFRKKLKEVEKDKRSEKEGVKINFVGNKDRFPKDIVDRMDAIESRTKNNTKFTLNFAMGYSGRQEIIDATSKIAILISQKKIKWQDIDETLFRKYLYVHSDPDLLIRTGGEQRISNFLLFQSAYTEFVFTKKLWPEFTKNDFVLALKDFSQRDRRFGK